MKRVLYVFIVSLLMLAASEKNADAQFASITFDPTNWTTALDQLSSAMDVAAQGMEQFNSFKEVIDQSKDFIMKFSTIYGGVSGAMNTFETIRFQVRFMQSIYNGIQYISAHSMEMNDLLSAAQYSLMFMRSSIVIVQEIKELLPVLLNLGKEGTGVDRLSQIVDGYSSKIYDCYCTSANGILNIINGMERVSARRSFDDLMNSMVLY